MPEASTRTAALLTGQVDWIEAPSPDAITRLKSAGMQIVTNVYPHDWPYLLNFKRGPFTDFRVRQAANYAINRQDIVDMLSGTAISEHDVVPPSIAYYGNPPKYDYDPKKAHALLDVYRAGVDKNANYDGLNFSRGLLDPVNAIIKLVGRAYWAPAGSNWGHYESPEAERLISEIFNEFDEEQRLSLLTQLHEFEGRDAVMIFVVHDLNPRAISPKLQGFIQAQNWFQDLTPVSVVP